MATADDLTAAVHNALAALDPQRKAGFLLETALSLIDAGKYGDDVERYLEVYLKTPNLPKHNIAKALLARANARKAAGEQLLAKAQKDFQAVLRLDPTNRSVQAQLCWRPQIAFARDPAPARTPPDIWSRIATFLPRYHLRTWLFLSPFHRSIAQKHIFHTLDLYLGEDQPEPVARALDIFDRVRSDRPFASLVKCLRVHWSYEEGELLDLMMRVFKSILPEFYALKTFEWIGYPELRADMVQTLFSTHPHLHSLGLVGFHFDACGISAFRSLRKLTLRAEDDDGYADMGEIGRALDSNASTLTHLVLGAYLHRQHSWDETFLSPTIRNLVQLDLVDTRISHVVLSRIVSGAGGAGSRLESLTLHGVLEEPGKSVVIFGSDEIVDGEHTLFPRLKSFRFLLVGQPPPQPPGQGQLSQDQNQVLTQEYYDPDILALYTTLAQFIRGRTKLVRLDLGSCPWELVAPLLPGLTGLRVLGVRIGRLRRVSGGGGVSLGGNRVIEREVETLVRSLPREMCALRIEVGVSEVPLYLYANQFTCFTSLSFLHLYLHTPPANLTGQTGHRARGRNRAHPQSPIVQAYPQSLLHPQPYHPPSHQPQPLPSDAPTLSHNLPANQSHTSPRRRQHQRGEGASTQESVPHDGENEREFNPNANTRSNASTPAPATSMATSVPPPPAPVLQSISGPHSIQHPSSRIFSSPIPAPIPVDLNGYDSAKHVAMTVRSLDFIGWNGELYVVVRNTPLPSRSTLPSSSAAMTLSSTIPQNELNVEPKAARLGAAVESRETIDLKELPARRRLDCGTGVDLGGEGPTWLERRDVPMDYDMPVGAAAE